MRHTWIAATFAIAFGVAHATTLDFGSFPDLPPICSASDDGSGPMIACDDFLFMSQGHGDVTGLVDVTYSQPGRPELSLRWWGPGYSDLHGVLWGDGPDLNSHARIEIKSLREGDGITLTHFDLGAFAHINRTTFVDVYAIGSSAPLFHFDGTVFAAPGHSSFDVNVSSANGLWIDWRNSAFNVAIDNITYRVDAMQAIPETQTPVLLLLGLGTMVFVVRRGRRE
jgi:hypothetical protein